LEKTLEEILEEYKNLVRAKAGIYFVLGLDKDDLIQEGMIGLVKAYNSFDPSCGASFKTYASKCIDNQIINAMQSVGRKKNSPLNTAVEIPEESAAGPLSNPEDAAIYRDYLDTIKSNKNGLLSDLEHKVLLLLLEGNDYTAIAKKLGRTPKSIDNAIQRMRLKLKRFLAGA